MITESGSFSAIYSLCRLANKTQIERGKLESSGVC